MCVSVRECVTERGTPRRGRSEYERQGEREKREKGRE